MGRADSLTREEAGPRGMPFHLHTEMDALSVIQQTGGLCVPHSWVFIAFLTKQKVSPISEIHYQKKEEKGKEQKVSWSRQYIYHIFRKSDFSHHCRACIPGITMNGLECYRGRVSGRSRPPPSSWLGGRGRRETLAHLTASLAPHYAVRGDQLLNTGLPADAISLVVHCWNTFRGKSEGENPCSEKNEQEGRAGHWGQRTRAAEKHCDVTQMLINTHWMISVWWLWVLNLPLWFSTWKKKKILHRRKHTNMINNPIQEEKGC